jgi:ABC-type dipeptide/oligopeptide/nickel transport system ATPase component
MMNPIQPLLSTRLSVYYERKLPVLQEIALEMREGEILGLVGQSGSGKSTLALAILGLLDMRRATRDGNIYFRGCDLLRLSEREMRAIRGRSLGLVLQSPLSSLNPALKIRTQLREAWKAHASGSPRDCDAAVEQALISVSLPADTEFLRRYPKQLSVGQAQRVLIAMAVMHRPALLVTDEATSALDVITQSQILALFARLNKENSMGILYISHDLPSIAGLCDRIAILHEGRIVECASSEDIFKDPQHSYTRDLVAALPETPVRNSRAAKATASSAG